MGALHRGHLELIRVAREAAGTGGEVAVSIFVNPLQFEPGADFERYPRPETVDEELCRKAGVDLLYRPHTVRNVCAGPIGVRGGNFSCQHALRQIAAWDIFAASARWYRSCSTFLRLHAAVFGEKDFQQLAIIRRMVRDLNFPDRDHRRADRARGGRFGVQLAQSIFEFGRAEAGDSLAQGLPGRSGAR